jgi:hypothetical protein
MTGPVLPDPNLAGPDLAGPDLAGPDLAGIAPGSWPMLCRRAFSSSACTATCWRSTSSTASARSPFTPARVDLSEDCWAEAAARSAARTRVAVLTTAICRESSEDTVLSLASARR